MLIPNKKNKVKNSKSLKYINYKIIIIPSILISYSFALIYATTQRGSIYKYIKENIIPVSTRVIIKDSLVYQYYKSNFSVNFPYNYIKGLMQKVDPIYLSINYKNLNKLALKRKEALKNSVLISSDRDYVNAVISDRESAVKAKIRLKGDWTDHLSSNKWSFRLKTKGNKVFQGMRKFSLQSPITRNYIWEWVYHELLRDEGLPSIRYKFRPLIINGNKLGTYAIEEHFDKILLESNNFKEGPIIKLSEEKLWESRFNKKSKPGKLYETYSTGFRLNYIRNNEVQKGNFTIANQLLNGFHNNLLTTSDVFDTDLLAKYFAINDLMNSKHSSIWHNMRFYFDPIQSKLIPIGFDANANTEKLKELSISNFARDSKNKLPFFNDKKFIKKYIKELERVSERKYLDQFFVRNKKEFDQNRYILYKSFPALDTNIKTLYENQKTIKNELFPISPLNIFLDEITNSHIILNIGNTQLLPVEIIGIKINENKININNKDLIINGRKEEEFTKYNQIKYIIDQQSNIENNNIDEIHVIYKVIGTKDKRVTKVNLFSRLNPIGIKDLLPNKISNINKISYLSVDKKENEISFKPGEHNLDKPLVIPPGYKLIAGPGVKINLKDKGLIISYSSLYFRGSKSEPIIISTTGKNNGLLVINAKQYSIINNIILKNISNITDNFWSVPGAITFYQSPIELSNSLFLNSNAEDAINIVRTKFKIINSQFNVSQSDAIDIDFSEGIIKNTFILDSGGDGIDISGSKVSIYNTKINKSGDKAISIGESSELEMNNISINNAFVGLANKDGSNSIIKNMTIDDSKVYIAGFQKKSEYSPSITTIVNFKYPSGKLKYLLSEGSILYIDNKKYQANSENSKIISDLYK